MLSIVWPLISLGARQLPAALRSLLCMSLHISYVSLCCLPKHIPGMCSSTFSAATLSTLPDALRHVSRHHCFCPASCLVIQFRWYKPLTDVVRSAHVLLSSFNVQPTLLYYTGNRATNSICMFHANTRYVARPFPCLQMNSV